MLISPFYLSQLRSLLIHCLQLAIRTPGLTIIFDTHSPDFTLMDSTLYILNCISECQEFFLTNNYVFYIVCSTYIVTIKLSLFTIIWCNHEIMQIFGLQVSLSCWCLTVQDSRAHHWRDCGKAGVWRIPKYCYIIISIKPGTKFFKG